MVGQNLGLDITIAGEQIQTPQQIISLKILQIPLLELQEELTRELEQNPVIELESGFNEEQLGNPLTDAAQAAENQELVADGDDDRKLAELIKLGDSWHDRLPSIAGGYDNDAAKRRDFMFNSQIEQPSLQDNLLEQLRLLDLATTQRQIIDAELPSPEIKLDILQMMGNKLTLEMVNKMGKAMQLRLKFDYTVNLPIMIRAVMKNKDNPMLKLSKEQKMAIMNHKKNVMDSITSTMEKSHMLSKKLKYSLLHGNMSKTKLYILSKKISALKEKVVNMKIVCISFLKDTLSKEQFTTLIKIDKKMPYLNYPYNY